MVKRINFLCYAAGFLFEVCFASLLVMVTRDMIMHRPFDIWFYGVILLVFYLSHLIRDKVSNLFVCVLLHVTFFVVAIFTPLDIFYKCALLFLTVFLIVASCMYINNGRIMGDSGLPWPVFAGCLIMYIFGYAEKNDYVMHISYIAVLILLIIYLIMCYLYGLAGYVNTYDDISGVPMKQIISSSSGTAALVVVITFFAMILGENKSLNAIFDGIVNIVQKMIYWITKAIVYLIRLLERVPTEEEYAPPIILPGANGGSSNDILFLVIIISLVCVVCIVCIWMLLRHTNTRYNGHDIIEDAEVEIDEEKEKIKPRLFNKLSKELKARYYYRQKVLKHKKEVALTKEKTCEVIRQEISDASGCDLSEITKLYSDIRYGSMIVDKEVLKRMNALRKQ